MTYRNGIPACASRILFFCLAFFLASFAVSSVCHAAGRPSTGKTATYFSQGQAINNAQDPAGSQQQAVHDFLIQAITQAMGAFVSPSILGGQFRSIQDRILKQPQRYVETYQIFSENPSNGLYRVTGQVTVSVDVLKKDLLDIGVPLAGTTPAMDEGGSTGGQGADSSSPDEQEENKERRGSSRGVILTKHEVFWAVTEKWEETWTLPRDRREHRALFLQSMLQESQDYDWSVIFPESVALAIDPEGNVSLAQVISAARSLGVSRAVSGTVGLQRKQGQQAASLEANLRVLDVSSGKPLGEIRKTYSLGKTTDQEGAMELASLVVPQLDRMAREALADAGSTASPRQASQAAQPERESVSEASPAEAPPAEAAPAESPSPSHAGSEVRAGSDWILVAPAQYQFAYLEEVQSLLRERSKSMQVKGIQIEGKEIRLRLDGVDGQTISSLQGARLRNGAQVQISAISQEERMATVTFSGPNASQPELRQ